MWRVAGGGTGGQRLPRRARWVQGAPRCGLGGAAALAQARGRRAGRRRLHQPRAPRPLRRPEPAAAGAGVGRRPTPAPLPVYALPGALDAVLALDRPGMLDDAYVLHEFTAGQRLDIGPFRADTRLLPHSVPNAGVRLAAGGHVLAYTGDTGPSPAICALSRGPDR